MKEYNHWRERQDAIKRKNFQDNLVLLTLIIAVGVMVWISL